MFRTFVNAALAAFLNGGDQGGGIAGAYVPVHGEEIDADGRGGSGETRGFLEDTDDGDFDQDEDATDDGESLAEDDDFEKRLATDTIGKDELDALSFTSEVGSYDEDAAASSVEEGNDAGNEKSLRGNALRNGAQFRHQEAERRG